jgi:RsiW-degrading membrane proteinase PrsW (M82 family)
MNIIFALLLAFAAPIILLPIEQVLNYPYIIEEIIKFFAISLIILQARQNNKSYLLMAIMVGVLFTISESTLYLVNFFLDGTFSLLPQRLIYTGLLHSGTSVLMYVLGRKNWWLMTIGLIISMLIHYYFNQIVSGF